MQQLGQYVLSLTATAMLCGVLISLFHDGTVKSILRMICGILMIVTAIYPLSDLDISDFSGITDGYLTEGKNIAAMGQIIALEEKQRCIQQQVEAYILDKADAMNASVTPQVILDREGLPVEVRLWGQCSEHIRQALTQMITNDLGIPEEDQKWTGET